MSLNTGNNPNIIRGKSKPDIEAIIAHTRTALLTKLRDEVEKECKNSEHRKGSVTSIGANGNEMTFFEPVLCGACKNFLALLEKVDE